MTGALTYVWEGDCFRPLKHCQKECDRLYTVGERYLLEDVHERSAKSHAQFFAALRQGWLSLPDHLAQQFPTPEALRKHALIRTGFRDERSIAASSRAEALRLASFIRPIDDHAIVTVTGSLVVVYTAKSQSYRQMGKADFQRSKQAVLDFVDDLLRVERGATAKAGEAA
jgi:hypothetical protein